MTVQVTNKQIFWCVESIWNQLDYKFKYQINQLTNQNSDEEHIQTIDISPKTFIQIMNAVNAQPQGVALDINPPLYDSLKAQVIPLAQAGNEEAQLVLAEMMGILTKNQQILAAKIENGKTQILE
ncbi:MAG: hypothetical protein U0T77_10795 [Chitinophagales bacterium]